MSMQTQLFDQGAGVGWEFDAPVESTRFVDRSWAAVGPCRLKSMWPGSKQTATTYNGTRWIRDGSMLNPSPIQGKRQGYDSSVYAQYAAAGDYRAELNVGNPARWPIDLEPGDQIYSTISVNQPGQRPQIARAGVLTIVDRPLEEGMHLRSVALAHPRIDTIDWAKLPELGVTVPTELDFDEVRHWIDRVWLVHGPDWPAKYMHPLEQMPYYGRDFCDRIGQAILWAMSVGAGTKPERQFVAGLAIQRGLDFFGWAKQAAGTPVAKTWKGPAAGHCIGIKWPTLFAGLMTATDEIVTLAGSTSGVLWSEDGQVFRVDATLNGGFGGYIQSEIGMDEWGVEHAITRENDDQRWLISEPLRPNQKPAAVSNSVSYRHVTHAAQHAQAAGVLAMDAGAHWNESWLSYHQRFVDTNRSRGITDYRMVLSPWTLAAYDKVRA